MTSKSLYFNLFIEDLKRRAWTAALSLLGFFIFLPVFTLLMLDRIKYYAEEVSIDEAVASFAQGGNLNNESIIFLTIAGAVICAVTGFSYLYSKSKVDLYHSIPIKREKLYLVSFINGILIYIVPYLLCLSVYFAIGMANGYMGARVITGAFTAVGIHFINYLLVYTTAVLAVMLTGKTLTGLLGCAVFFIYAPFTYLLKNELFSEFFTTYTGYGQNEDIQLSPLMVYTKSISLVDEGRNAGLLLGGIFAVAVILAAVSCVLYKLRSSEAAGRAMAFKPTEAPVKILVVVPTALLGGAIFMSMSYSSVIWFVFGTVFVGILAHSIIQIIYTGDLRSILQNKWHMAVSVLSALAVIGILYFDLTGYDSYIPAREKIKSVGLSLSGIDEIGPSLEIAKSGDYEYLQYGDMNLYRLNNAVPEDIGPVYDMLKDNLDNRENLPDRDLDGSNGIQIYVRYTLDNDKEVYRRYNIPVEENMDYLNGAYVQEGYKEGSIQLYTMPDEYIHDIHYLNKEKGRNELLDLTKAEQKELLELYKEEKKVQTLFELRDSFPVTNLIVTIGTADRNDEIEQCYSVYPSFVKTLAYMKEKGAGGIEETEEALDPSQVLAVRIIDYDTLYGEGEQIDGVTVENWNGSSGYVFTDPEHIKAIVPTLVNAGLRVDSVFIKETRNLRITVEFKDNETGDYSINISAELPEIIKQIIKKGGSQ